MRLTIGVVIAILGLATAASAQRAVFDSCVYDMQKLCADTGGGGKMMECLKKNQDKLSAGCKTAVANAEKGGGSSAKRGGRIQACQPDIAKLCKDVPRGGGRLAECLRSHEAQLSAECKESLKKKPAAKPTAAATVKPTEKK